MRNKYTLIVCTNELGVIGRGGDLLYHIKADLANFKSLTTSNVVIMGRKTFESLPNMQPLKDRVNIIVTTQKDYKLPCDICNEELYKNTYVVNSLEEADELCYAYFEDLEKFIIGGGELYRQSLEKDMIEKAIITHVNREDEGDVMIDYDYIKRNFTVVFKTTALRDHANDIYYKYFICKRKNND